MQKKRVSVTVRCSEDDKELLKRLGGTEWSSTPNISRGLQEALLTVRRSLNGDLTPPRLLQNQPSEVENDPLDSGTEDFSFAGRPNHDRGKKRTRSTRKKGQAPKAQPAKSDTTDSVAGAAKPAKKSRTNRAK